MAGLGKSLVVFDEDQVHHQPDHLTRGEVFSCSLIGEFRELSDQLLEDKSHLGVAHRLWVQVDLRKLLSDQIQQVGFLKVVHLKVELEALKDVPYCRAECLDVGAQVFADVVRITHQPLHVQCGAVAKELICLCSMNGSGSSPDPL